MGQRWFRSVSQLHTSVRGAELFAGNEFKSKRPSLTRQEDDQLFIDESSASRATEQSQLIAKVNKINPLVKLVGATSGLMILAIAGWAVYLGLNSVQP
jgi:hypothetical protein